MCVCACMFWPKNNLRKINCQTICQWISFFFIFFFGTKSNSVSWTYDCVPTTLLLCSTAFAVQNAKFINFQNDRNCSFFSSFSLQNKKWKQLSLVANICVSTQLIRRLYFCNLCFVQHCVVTASSNQINNSRLLWILAIVGGVYYTRSRPFHHLLSHHQRRQSTENPFPKKQQKKHNVLSHVKQINLFCIHSICWTHSFVSISYGKCFALVPKIVLFFAFNGFDVIDDVINIKHSTRPTAHRRNIVKLQFSITNN